jgi:hypothetical protein
VEAAKDNSSISGAPAVYFYFENSLRTMLKGSDLFSSFIKQLLVYLAKIRKPCPPEVDEQMAKFFGAKRLDPDFDDLADMFVTLCNHTPRAIYVVDGLDELDQKEVGNVLRIIRKLFGSKGEQHGSRILLFSRDQVAPYLDVTRCVPGTAHISTSNGVAKDIQQYIETVIEEKIMYVRELTSDQTLMEETKRRLLEGASGM